ncbi:diguanylate cyclase [bacterium]|nr:diguanylate cyclase [bacterium]
MPNKIKEDFSFKIILLISIIILISACFLSEKTISKLPLFNTTSLITTTEAKTFDLRQRYLSNFRKPSDEIIIICVDNHSFEYMTKKFGYWPMPRSVYTDMIEYVMKQNPRVFGIDIQFTGEWTNRPQDDINLARAFEKYDNIFSALYFDDAPSSKRTPQNISEKHSSNLKIKSDYFEPYYPKNFRASYPLMLEIGNLANVNINDYYDGIVRALPMFVEYPVYDENLNITGSRYYPNLALRIVSKYAGHNYKGYLIDKNNNIIVGNKKIPMKSNTEVVLNWYYKINANQDNIYTSFYKTVPFKDLYDDIERAKNGEATRLDNDLFRDKVVLFGFTSESLFDLKTTPVEKYLPGVELYGIFTNNFIDNSFIVKVNEKQTLILSLLIFSILFTGFYYYKPNLQKLTCFIGLVTGYIILSYLLMFYKYLWLPLILPLFSIILSYLLALVLNYFTKSKDYDRLYKLVNIDDLTGLYNKRFFTKHMEMNIEYSSVYKKPFSLIMIDIDHFKKFNDTFGHLSGDCVLKQVAGYLKEVTGDKGVVCRYGGEEMCVILPHTNFDDAEKHAWELCKKIATSEFILADGQKTSVTISLGVSEYPSSATTTIKLVEVADRGLYFAKEHGRNQVGKS